MKSKCSTRSQREFAYARNTRAALTPSDCGDPLNFQSTWIKLPGGSVQSPHLKLIKKIKVSGISAKKRDCVRPTFWFRSAYARLTYVRVPWCGARDASRPTAATEPQGFP